MDVYAEAQVARAGGLDGVEALAPLYEARGWLRFLAWVSIVGGVIQCLTIVGAIIGWVPIWIGVLLLRTAGGVEQGTRARDSGHLRSGMASLATAVRVQAVLVTVGLLLTLGYIAIVLVALLIGAMN